MIKLPSQSLPNAVFVYGTLMSPQVVEVLLGRIPKSTSPCRLWGYSRHPVRDQVYPAIIAASETAFVDGRIWRELSDSEMKAFDWFEEEDYQRTRVPIALPSPPKTNEETNQEQSDTTNLVATDAYIWANPVAELEVQEEWSYETFCQQHLEWYLSNTVHPCRIELDRLHNNEL